MTEFWVDQAGSGAYMDMPSEDVTGHVARGGTILMWAIDGASPLTDEPFTVFQNESNSGWFARRLSECLKTRFVEQTFNPAQLREVIGELRAEFIQCSGSPVPDWSWPVAAAVMVEVSELDGRVRIEVHRYSDCFFATAQGTLEADVTKARRIADAISTGRWKPASGFSGKTLTSLRERRARQQDNEGTTALTLNPESAMNASAVLLNRGRPLHVLVGSDGVSRLWESYAAMTISDAMSVVAREGVGGLIAELRRFEACAVLPQKDEKPSDDACCIHLFIPGSIRSTCTKT